MTLEEAEKRIKELEREVLDWKQAFNVIADQYKELSARHLSYITSQLKG